jgi:hypothetical protein
MTQSSTVSPIFLQLSSNSIKIIFQDSFVAAACNFTSLPDSNPVNIFAASLLSHMSEKWTFRKSTSSLKNRGKLQTFFRHLLLFKCIQTMTIQREENGLTFGESLPYQNSPKLLLAAHVSCCSYSINDHYVYDYVLIMNVGYDE